MIAAIILIQPGLAMLFHNKSSLPSPPHGRLAPASACMALDLTVHLMQPNLIQSSLPGSLGNPPPDAMLLN